MVKTISGSSLTILDKQVNDFFKENPTGKVINFTASCYCGSVPKMIYVYVIEYEDINSEYVTINKEYYESVLEMANKYEGLCE